MSDELQPESIDELASLIKEHRPVLAVGNRTKAALSDAAGTTRVSLGKLSGVIAYQPSEFTFTAHAGTTIAEIQKHLSEQRQYLPFDPPWVDQGATLGGTVAAGLSGPGRVRYGGIRDFLLGVKLLSGDGNVINAGGKVVKNAAGFDIPKLLVGSLGRLGVITEMTFKVFPQAANFKTLQFHCDSHHVAVDMIAKAASSRWEPDAIDYNPQARSLWIRIGGPESAVDAIASEIKGTLAADATVLSHTQADRLWSELRNLKWPRAEHADTLIKVATTPSQFLSLVEDLQDHPGVSMHLSAAGGLLWVAVDPESLALLESSLLKAELSGLVIRGNADSIFLGQVQTSEMALAIKRAMDPADKFPRF